MVPEDAGVNREQRRRLDAIADFAGDERFGLEVVGADGEHHAARSADDDVIVKARGTAHGARHGAPEDLVARQQVARADVGLQLAAAEGVVLVLGADVTKNASGQHGDVVLREHVADRIDAIRRRRTTSVALPSVWSRLTRTPAPQTT